MKVSAAKIKMRPIKGADARAFREKLEKMDQDSELPKEMRIELFLFEYDAQKDKEAFRKGQRELITWTYKLDKSGLDKFDARLVQHNQAKATLESKNTSAMPQPPVTQEEAPVERKASEPAVTTSSIQASVANPDEQKASEPVKVTAPTPNEPVQIETKQDSASLTVTVKSAKSRELELACVMGDLEKVENLIESKQVTPDEINDSLHAAIKGNIPDIVSYLFEKGAMPTLIGPTKENLMHTFATMFLGGPARAKILDILQQKFPKMLEEMDSDGCTPFVLGLRERPDHEAVKLFLLAGSAFYPDVSVSAAADSKATRSTTHSVMTISVAKEISAEHWLLREILWSITLILLLDGQTPRQRLTAIDKETLTNLLKKKLNELPLSGQDVFMRGLVNDDDAFKLIMEMNVLKTASQVKRHQESAADMYGLFRKKLFDFLQPSSARSEALDSLFKEKFGVSLPPQGISGLKESRSRRDEMFAFLNSFIYQTNNRMYQEFRADLKQDWMTNKKLFGSALLVILNAFKWEQTYGISQRANMLVNWLLCDFSSELFLFKPRRLALENAVRVGDASTVALMIEKFEELDISSMLHNLLCDISKSTQNSFDVSPFLPYMQIPFKHEMDEKLIQAEIVRRQQEVPMEFKVELEYANGNKKVEVTTLMGCVSFYQTGEKLHAEKLQAVLKTGAVSKRQEEKQSSPLEKLWNACQDNAEKYPEASARVLIGLCNFTRPGQAMNPSIVHAVACSALAIKDKTFFPLLCELLQIPKKTQALLKTSEDVVKAFRYSQPVFMQRYEPMIDAFRAIHAKKETSFEKATLVFTDPTVKAVRPSVAGHFAAKNSVAAGASVALTVDCRR